MIRFPYLIWTRAEFCRRAEEIAARLLPGLSLPVADTDLHGRAWGLMSRSAGICLDLGAIEAATAPYDGPCFVRVNCSLTALGLLVHEITHAACWKNPGPPALTPTEATAVVERWAARDETEPPDPCPWHDDHGLGFVRMALHVRYRAQRLLRLNIDPASVIDSTCYGLSGIGEYRAALGTEPAALKSKPFTTILETCPPRPFIELWRGDVQRWLSNIDSPTPEQRAAVVDAQSLFS